MIAGLAHYHEEYGGRNDRTALVWLVYNNPEEYSPQVWHSFGRLHEKCAASNTASTALNLHHSSMLLCRPHTTLAASSLEPTIPVLNTAGAVRVQVLHRVLLARAEAGNILHHPLLEDGKVQPVQPGTEHHIQPPAAGPLPPVQVCSLHKRLLSGCTFLRGSQVQIATSSL
jgi:hypothetical protein